MIDYLLRKHRGEIFASLYDTDTVPAALNRETLKQTLPLHANVMAMMVEQSEANTGAMLACASAIQALERDALRAGWAAVSALKAHRASANRLGDQRH